MSIKMFLKNRKESENQNTEGGFLNFPHPVD